MIRQEDCRQRFKQLLATGRGDIRFVAYRQSENHASLFRVCGRPCRAGGCRSF